MTRRTHERATGFTLTELMVAVVIMIVVIAATSKLFGTASRVTGLGQAGAAVLQEAAAIERQIREDFDKLSREGFLVIRCVAVRNDVNVVNNEPLLNPALPEDALLRADQLVFFTQGVDTSQSQHAQWGSLRKGQSAAARVYYGHAIQVPDGPAVEMADDGDSSFLLAIDPEIVANDPLVPWYLGERNFERTRFEADPAMSPGDYSIAGNFGDVDITQPRAVQWLLARQTVLLADDGQDWDGYLVDQLGGTGQIRGGSRSTDAITHRVIRNGRVDVAASELGDLRAAVLPDTNGDGVSDQRWVDQRDIIAGAVFYPRAELLGPSMHRVDQALTNHVLGGACSSFIIDWTYENNVGAAVNDAGTFYRGVVVYPENEQPWFGLDLAGDPSVSRGVQTFEDYSDNLIFSDQPETIDPPMIEELDPPGSFAGDEIQDAGAIVYEAIFGYNQDTPLDANGNVWPFGTNFSVAFTPWPSAIRITMVLHDTETKLETGRVVQFVIDLPKRNQ